MSNLRVISESTSSVNLSNMTLSFPTAVAASSRVSSKFAPVVQSSISVVVSKLSLDAGLYMFNWSSCSTIDKNDV